MKLLSSTLFNIRRVMGNLYGGLFAPKNFIKKSKLLTTKASIVIIAFSVFGLVPLVNSVYANRFDQQINELRQENSQNRAEQQELGVEEESLSDRIASIQANIATINEQISQSQADHREAERKIEQAKAEIERQRVIMGGSIKQLYFDDKMTTIEKVASSRNLSEYADKAQYRISVQNKIKTSMDIIDQQKQEQEKQKAKIEKLLADQRGMRSELDAQRAENARLLALNREEQEKYEEATQSNNSRIADLQRQQAAENARLAAASSSGGSSGGFNYGGTGSYPWPHVHFPNTIVDPWGMFKRQCVSYTAWKVASTGRHMPYWGGRGNANLWPSNARAAGIPVSSTPRVGAVAVSMAGFYGHTMYVEAVHGNGTITISEYNAGWDGRYSTRVINAGGLQYIYF